jgi:predicted ATP-dependent endonuclease of OLD family
MKLKAFRVKNYRSIVDTDWCQLSKDNITVLIGQNESGKTSVLEGLQSFFTGQIDEDILRSDLSMPEIICSIDIQNSKMENIVDFAHIPEEAIPLFTKLKSISIARKWDELFNSVIVVAEKSIQSFYQEREKEKEKSLRQTQSKLKKIADEYQNLEEEYNTIQQYVQGLNEKINNIKSDLKTTKKKASRSRKEELKTEAQGKVDDLESIVAKEEKTLEEKEQKLEKLSAQLKEKNLKYKIAQYIEEASKECEKLQSDANDKYEHLKQLEATFHLLNTPKENRSNGQKLSDYKTEYRHSIDRLNRKKTDYEYWILVGQKILNGTELEQAENETREEIEQEAFYYTLEELGNIIFDQGPIVEFFHDFSSLLPDRIDLEDVIYQKENVKGFKAVRNYLEIANLKPEFFDQQNSRILKQKIEKLNKEITVDFHEYWEQSIGKHNKIHISFELEHYDHNTPEKMGKPYIEFWIKDKDERLYPKQRSRGVRWFLSFYLELKAFAKYKHRNRILLIDEPAMSLHARAQDDVLKVFEDIKNDFQVLYTTHSPHLVDKDKLYRILALQRNDNNGYSETIVFDANSFKLASSDTLSPIYSLMGARLNEQKFIQNKNNIILEDMATYYYFKSISRILGIKSDLYYLPASDNSHIITLANLLLGWKLEFTVILGNNPQNIEIYNYFKHHLFHDDEDLTNKNILLMDEGHKQIEDIFSTLDFKKYILNKRIGITESNSDFIKGNNLSRSILASDFLSLVEEKNLSLDDFDDQTTENLKKLFGKMQKLLGKQTIPTKKNT